MLQCYLKLPLFLKLPLTSPRLVCRRTKAPPPPPSTANGPPPAPQLAQLQVRRRTKLGKGKHVVAALTAVESTLKFGEHILLTRELSPGEQLRGVVIRKATTQTANQPPGASEWIVKFDIVEEHVTLPGGDLTVMEAPASALSAPPPPPPPPPPPAAPSAPPAAASDAVALPGSGSADVVVPAAVTNGSGADEAVCQIQTQPTATAALQAVSSPVMSHAKRRRVTQTEGGIAKQQPENAEQQLVPDRVTVEELNHDDYLVITGYVEPNQYLHSIRLVMCRTTVVLQFGLAYKRVHSLTLSLPSMR